MSEEGTLGKKRGREVWDFLLVWAENKPESAQKSGEREALQPCLPVFVFHDEDRRHLRSVSECDHQIAEFNNLLSGKGSSEAGVAGMGDTLMILGGGGN